MVTTAVNANRSALVVDGSFGGSLTHALVDTGSEIAIMHVSSKSRLQ